MNKRYSIVAATVLGLMLNCFVLIGVSEAQNRAVGVRAVKKAAVTKRAGKAGKVKNKGKNKEMGEDEDGGSPRIVRLAPRPDSFQAEAPISETAQAFGITPAIGNMLKSKVSMKSFDGEPVIRDEENNEVQVERTVPAGLEDAPFIDPLAAKGRARFSILSPQAMPGPAVSFNGILGAEIIAALNTGSMPPDTVGDVGPNHYVQAANIGVFRIYNKTGTPLTPIARISTLFAGLPANDLCRTRDDGDPVVNYDPLADRWMVSQFYATAPFGQCIAVSQTGDPTGAWYAYDFPTPNGNFADYPHWAVWMDGYYLATHEFNPAGTAYVQGGFYAFNRNKMIAGDPSANYVYFSDPNSYGHLPADVDGYAAPPAGTSELFMEFDAALFGGSDRIITHELVPDYTTPANSTFGLKPDVAVAPFDPRAPSGRAQIEQPVVASSAYLDSIYNHIMYRIAYRNIGTTAAPVSSYVMNWTVNVSGVAPTTAATYQAAIRWEELRRSGAGALSVFDQGTHAPDPASGTGRNRWLGSIAQDNQGNIGLGFSRSGLGATDFPDIVWAGRTGGQVAAGTLNEGEATMHASTGYQNITNNRWGDYSAMTVDPTDDCTFWFTNEWRDAANNASTGNAPFNWSTRIGSFKFPGCSAAPKGQISANVTSCATGQPVSGASVVAQTGGFLRMTNASGNLISNIIAAPGNYTLTAFKKGYQGSTSTTVTVADGGTATGTVCLSGAISIIELTATPAATPTDENGNGRLDPGETATLNLPLKNTGALNATAVSATLTTSTAGVTIVAPQTQSYPDIASDGGTANSPVPFKFKLASNFDCGAPINFTLTVNYGGGATATQTFNFTIATAVPLNITSTLDTTAPANGSNYTATTGTQVGRIARTGVGSDCSAAKTAPGLTATSGDRRFDAYTFTALNTGCFTVTMSSTNGSNLFSAAYNNSGFVPANPNTNFLADPGTSAASVTYSFNVSAGQKFTVVVHEVTPAGAIGSNYTLGISGPVTGACLVDAAPVISYTPVQHQPTTANPTVGVTVTDDTGIPTTGSLLPRVYFRKQGTTAYSSTQCSLTGGGAKNATFNCTIDYNVIGGVTAPNSITYFVAAQDVEGNIGSNPPGVAGSDVVNITTAPSSPNIYTVGDGATIPAGSYTNMNAGNETLGGNATVLGTLTLSGILNTGANTLLIDCGGTVSGGGVTNFIIGNERKNFCAPQSFTYNVGTTTNNLTSGPEAVSASGYSPVTANVTAVGTNPSSLTVSDTDAFLDGSNMTNSASRFWTLTETGAITANLSFTYTDADVVGTEATYKVLRRENNVTTQLSGSNNAATNTETIAGVTEFSQWAVGTVPGAPTAALVNVSGRATTTNGRGIRNVRIEMTDAGGNVRTATTTAFGYYRFADVAAGETYIITARGKSYTFSQPTQVVNVGEEVTNIDFIGTPSNRMR